MSSTKVENSSTLSQESIKTKHGGRVKGTPNKKT